MRFDSSAPLDSSSDPITGDFLRQALDALRREIFSTLHVAMPGTVIAYDASDGTVSVRPALSACITSYILTFPAVRSVSDVSASISGSVLTYTAVASLTSSAAVPVTLSIP